MGTDCGHSFIKLYNFACTGVNHNPQMKIAPSELCLWEEGKKKTNVIPNTPLRLLTILNCCRLDIIRKQSFMSSFVSVRGM